MAFTYDSATDIGKLRFKVGDTLDNALTPRRGIKPGGSNVSDAELQAVLDEEGSVGRAAAAVAEAMQAAWASYTDIFVGGRAGRSEYLSKVTDAWAKKAASLRKQFGGSAGVTSAQLVRRDAWSANAESLPTDGS